MRRLCALVLFSLVGCSVPQGSTTQPVQALQCSNGDTPVYTSRFAAQSGGSGVATAEDAVAGKTNSDPPGGGFSGAPTSESKGTAVDDVAPGGGAAETPVAPTPSIPAGPLTAMVATCGQSGCPVGQVAVEAPPALGSTPVATGGAVGEGFISPPATGTAIDSSTVGGTTVGTGVSSTTVGSTVASPPSDLVPPTPDTPPVTSVPLLCVDPPPACPGGQSPQYTARAGWECTDCSYVVTYGGIYGNYRRCVSAPQIKCGAGQVPTWVFENDQWECKDTCDNGEYDQHMLNGILVCVPC